MLMLKKSEAVSKFEYAMSSVFKTSLQKSVINALIDVKEPIFNKDLNADKIADLTVNWHKMSREFPSISSDVVVNSPSH